MTHSELSSISPLRNALNVLTNRGQLPLPPELAQIIVLDGSALDTEEDKSPLAASTPRRSPWPSPHLPPRRSQSQSTGTTSSAVSPRLGLVSFGRRAVSLARRASSSASGGVRKWQPGERQRRSTGISVTRTSRAETARQQSLLFSPPDDPPSPGDPSESTGITTHSLSTPPESMIPLSALDVSLASFPAPSPLMSLPSLSPIAGDDDDIAHDIPAVHSASIADVTVPAVLQVGTPMTKVSRGKQKKVVFRLNPDQGQIIWESKKYRISTSLLLTRPRFVLICSFGL
jgi:hypothetical protein